MNREERIVSFNKDLKELLLRYELEIKPQITPDGPTIVLIDVKPKSDIIV